MNNQASDEVTIDLLELAKVILSKIWIVIICAVVGAAAGFTYTKFFMPDKYQASSMIYIYTKTTSVTSLADLQIGSALSVDFQTIAKTREVVDAVREELGVNYSYEDLAGRITVESPANSRILKITVVDTDPVMAANLSNSLSNQLRLRVAAIMDTDAPSIVSRAVVPSNPVGPSAVKNGCIGCLLLVFLAVGILTVIYITDDTIKSEEDVNKYLGLNVIAAVPTVPSLSKVGSGKGKA
ncbi:MAG: Wzz/FepE/Etk N-terminal domain-containing protein [Clostridia bacterium]|nr:Wzz/FepE/Etk N-terminal domain-containing protein [Clostridia bacterium]